LLLFGCHCFFFFFTVVGSLQDFLVLCHKFGAEISEEVLILTFYLFIYSFFSLFFSLSAS
jgi:hypothetical protein